jgi:putative peptidoglycan lipid II flippase
VDDVTGQRAAPARRWRTLVNTAMVMLGVLLSRVLGLVRDATIYSRYAPGDPALDAYVAAFRVPDFIYAVVIGGALATTLIPVFQQEWHERGEERAWRVASAVFNVVLIVLLVVLAAVAIFAPALVGALFGAEPPAQQALITQLTRLFLLSPLFLGIGGVVMALLNARERFGVPAFAFNVYNLAIIFVALLLSPWLGILGVAYGVVLGALLYVVVQLPALVRAGLRFSPVLLLRDPAVRRVGRQIVPRLVGQSAVQLNFIATTSFAALLAGNQIAALNGAYQLMLLPHGVFVMSLVTVLFPQMADRWARGERAEFRDTVLRAVRLVIFVTMPIAMALAVLRVPVIRLIFERGSFDMEATALVAAPLLLYLTSVVAFSVSEPTIRAFYAMQDTRTPVVVALLTVALNIALGFAVVQGTTWGAAGLALAFSIANNAEALVLVWLLWGRLGLRKRTLLRPLLAIGASTAAMGTALWGILRLSSGVLPMVTLAGAYGQGADALLLASWLVVAGAVGGVVYLGAALALRVPEVREAVALVRRR